MVRWLCVLLLIGSVTGCASASDTTRFELAELSPRVTQADGDAVVAGRHDAEFALTPPGTEHVDPNRHGNRWWRVRPLQVWNDAERPLLVFYAPYGNAVTVRLPPDYEPQRRTLRDPDLDPRWSRHALVFPLPATLAPDTPVYFFLDQGRRFPPQLALQSAAEFARGDVVYLRAISAIFTTIGVMLLVVIAFALALREPTLLFLAGAFALTLVYLMLITGEAYALPGLRDLGALGVVPVWLARSLGSACLLAFVSRFLDLPLHAPRLARLLDGCALAFVFLAVAVLVPLPAQRAWVPLLGNGLLFGSSALMLLAGVVAWRRGVRAARFFLPAWVPVLALDMLREVQLLGFTDVYPGNEYAQPLAAALAAVLFTSGMADRLLAVRRERDLARDEAERDALTGVLNRKAMLLRVENAFAHARRSEDARFCVLFLDLDHFKRINDSHGHAAGDACLKALVQNVRHEFRQGDALGRWGGEEFIALLSGAGAEHAEAVAERIRANIEFRCREVSGIPLRLTVSIGLAEHGPRLATPAALIAAADEAMYAAKRAGRNRVRRYGDAESGRDAGRDAARV